MTAGTSDLPVAEEAAVTARAFGNRVERLTDVGVAGVHRLLEMLKGDFEPKTWQAFTRMALDGLPAAEVAQELGLTTNAVFIAKSRVLARLRQEAAGLVES